MDRLPRRLAPVGIALALTLALLIPVLAAPVPQGASFTVNTDVDSIDAIPGNGFCADGDGLCSLRAAVMEANALSTDDTIHVPGGPTNPAPALSLAGASEDASATGDLDIVGVLTITGDGMASSGASASGLGDRAVHVLPGATLHLSGVGFVWANAGAADGGGLLNEGIVSMVEATFQMNQARQGAGILNRGDLTMLRSLVGYNTASESGGGIRNEGTLTIDQSTVANNELLSGPAGGIDNFGHLVLRNSTVSQNRARNTVAGILNHASATAFINNTTIFLNLVDPDGSSLPATGGVFNEGGGSVQMGNSILAMNQDDWNLPNADCRGLIESGGYNLFGTLADCTLTGETAGNLVGVDPRLPGLPTVDPAQTWGYPPEPGSPAINSGNPAPVGSGPAACEAIDQRDYARPIGYACDIGAYEVEAGAEGTPIPTGTPTDTTTPTPTGTTTLTATATPTPGLDILFADGFETGDLSAWSSSRTDYGDLSVSAEARLGGAFGLQAALDDNRSIYVVDETPAAETAYQARFYFDPNGLRMASGNAHVLFQAIDGAGLAAFRVELRSFQGDYQARAVALRDGGQFATAWFTLIDAPHFLEVGWSAASGIDTFDGALRFWVDGALKAENTALDNDTRRVETVRLGAVVGVDTATRGIYFFDAFASRRGAALGADPSITLPEPPDPPDAIFSDGFESGDLSAWSAAKGNGDLLVNSGSAIVGSYGMETILNDTAVLYVTDWSPFADHQYRARFAFDPNSLTMLDGRSHVIFQALTGTSKAVARVELRFKSDNYEIRGGLLGDDSRWYNTGWWTIDDGPQTVELYWWAAASPAVADGGLTMWINEAQSETRSGVLNSGLQIDFARLGAVAGIDRGTLGSMYFDAFESRRETYLGFP